MVSPLVAAIISFFVPGLGRLIVGENTKKGIIILVIALVLATIVYASTNDVNMAFIPWFIVGIYAAYDVHTALQ